MPTPSVPTTGLRDVLRGMTAAFPDIRRAGYRDGRWAESRITMDVAGLLAQLGVLPAAA